jgi:predicted nucleic acid-binding protein
MSNEDLTLKAEVAEVRVQLADALHRLARAEGTIEQLNRSIASGNRMTNWQFIGFVLVMAGTLYGTLTWATAVLERRIDQVEKNVTTLVQKSEENTNRRFDDVNKRFDDMNKRFDDLRQVVLSQQQKR